jgi:hypothetical protein
MGSNIIDSISSSKTNIEEGLDIHPNQSSVSTIAAEDFREVNVSLIYPIIAVLLYILYDFFQSIRISIIFKLLLFIQFFGLILNKSLN